MMEILQDMVKSRWRDDSIITVRVTQLEKMILKSEIVSPPSLFRGKTLEP